MVFIIAFASLSLHRVGGYRIGIGTKHDFGFVFALKFFVIDDLALELYFSGNVHIFGVGLELSYFPAWWDFLVYPNIGLSYLETIYASWRDGRKVNKETKGWYLNFDLGINRLRFNSPLLFANDPDNQRPTALYLELALGQTLWKEVRINSQTSQQKGGRSFIDNLWFPNAKLGFHQGGW